MGKELKVAMVILAQFFLTALMFLLVVCFIWTEELPAKIMATVFVVCIVLWGIHDFIREEKKVNRFK